MACSAPADEERREAAELPQRKPAVQAAAGPAGAVPIFFDFPEIGGSASIEPRWGHGAAALGERLYVYGGLAAKDRPLRDIHFFSISERRASGCSANERWECWP